MVMRWQQVSRDINSWKAQCLPILMIAIGPTEAVMSGADPQVSDSARHVQPCSQPLTLEDTSSSRYHLPALVMKTGLTKKLRVTVSISKISKYEIL